MQRLKDIEDYAEADGDPLNEERKVPAMGYSASTARSDHHYEGLPKLNGSPASQHSVAEVLPRSIPAASLRSHPRSQTQNSHVSQASQHSKKSQ